MPDVHEFELFHGIVLTKISRSKRPLTLRMIETKVSVAWSAYTINDEVILYIKHSKAPKSPKRGSGSKVWQFTYNPDDIQKLADLRKRKQVFVALACGAEKVADKNMQVCLIFPDQLTELLDLSLLQSQSIRVKYTEGNSLRVSGSASSKELVVPRNRLDKWDIPGS